MRVLNNFWLLESFNHNLFGIRTQMCMFTVFFGNEVSQSNKKQTQEPFERISWFLMLTHWKTYQGARSARGCGIDGVWAPQRWGDVIVRWEDLSWWFETSMISTEQFSVDFSQFFLSNSLVRYPWTKITDSCGNQSMGRRKWCFFVWIHRDETGKFSQPRHTEVEM